MAREIVNIGTTANDRQGDSLRDGGAKINRNFAELYEVLGGDSATLASNVSLDSNGLVFAGVTYNTTLTAIEGSNTVNLVLPDSSGTLVTTTSSQTISNKTITNVIIDSATFNNLIINDLDSSHTYIITPSNLTADRVATLPALSANDTFVFRAQTETLTNKTLASPRITTAILDGNGAELIRATSTASAVNEVTIANAATGSGPVVSATGNDTNINLEVASKGTGAVVLGKVAFSSKQVGVGDSDTSQDTIIIGNPSTSLAITLNNGTIDGEHKILVNRGSGSFIVSQSGTNFQLPGGATSITLAANGAAQLVWVGGVSKWFMLGSPDSADSLVSIS